MRIVVVGEVLLDRDVEGASTRLCPDAPVPVVDVERVAVRAGGAGLVARLLAGDGHTPTLVTAMANDAPARELRRCLDGINLVAGPSNGPTPVKTRVLKSGSPVVRFDEGCAEVPEPTATPAMLSAIASAEVLIVADYGRGLLAQPGLRRAIAERTSQVPVVWDPHPKGSPPVPGTTVVTPNLDEAMAAARLSGEHPHSLGQVAAALRTFWQASAVAVTVGADGTWLHTGNRPEDGEQVPAARRLEGIDTCGAGDRFAAGLAVALASTEPADLRAAVGTAVAATADFLSRGGVRSLPLPAPGSPKVRPPGARQIIDQVRAEGGTVVATGGCFDLVHAGHVRTLRAARAHGDSLIVCLNTDASVRRLKGNDRPLMSQEDRMELLLALDCVDAVAVFSEDSPVRLLEWLRPDIWVKGGDYIAELLPEYELVTSWGGTCVTVPFHPGRSTTALAAALGRIA